MTSLILFVLYWLLVLIEATILYRIADENLKLDWPTALVDTLIVNLISLVLIVVLFGPSLMRIDNSARGNLGDFFKAMMIVWPQEIIKVSLFSIAADAIALTVYYAWRYPRLNLLETATKGAMMNIPALLVAGVSWIFVSIMYEFLRFIRVV